MVSKLHGWTQEGKLAPSRLTNAWLLHTHNQVGMVLCHIESLKRCDDHRVPPAGLRENGPKQAPALVPNASQAKCSCSSATISQLAPWRKKLYGNVTTSHSFHEIPELLDAQHCLTTLAISTQSEFAWQMLNDRVQ